LDSGVPEASAEIGAGGGTIVSPDGLATLEVPAGALVDTTTITVRQFEATDETVARIYDFGPDGLTFAVPAILTITGLSAPPADMQNVIAVDEGSGFTDLSGISLETLAIGSVDGFSRFTVVIRDGVTFAQSECSSVASGFAACGGDETGDWTVTQFCFEDTPLGPDPLRGACPGVTVDITLPFAGSVALDGSALDISWSDVTLTGTLNIPKSCLATSCDRMGCPDGGETCACPFSHALAAGSITDTYTASGTTLMATDLGSIPYCASGSTLTAQITAPDDIVPLFGGNRPTITFELERDGPREPASCKDLYDAGERADGLHTVTPDGTVGGATVEVVCDMTTAGGGWTLLVTTSDDGVATWTMDARNLWTTDTSTVGDVSAPNEDFKSAIYHDLRFRDLLFINAPSGEYAAYYGVGDGSIDLGTFIGAQPYPNCNPGARPAGSGYPMSAGTIMADPGAAYPVLCDTNLYFNAGDIDGVDATYCGNLMSLGNQATFGPSWNISANSGCPFDDSHLGGFGPSNGLCTAASCMGAETQELHGRGFAVALGLYVGPTGVGARYTQMWAR
jgi:hypothetical protein